MKAKEIKIELNFLDVELKKLIKYEGSTNIEKIVMYSKVDLTEYIRGTRKWSWKKILEVAEKLEL